MRVKLVRSLKFWLIGALCGGVTALVIAAVASVAHRTAPTTDAKPVPVCAAGFVTREDAPKGSVCLASAESELPHADADSSCAATETVCDRSSAFCEGQLTSAPPDESLGATTYDASADVPWQPDSPACPPPLPPAPFPTAPARYPLATLPESSQPDEHLGQPTTSDEAGHCQTCELWRTEDNTRLATVVITPAVKTSRIDDAEVRSASATSTPVHNCATTPGHSPTACVTTGLGISGDRVETSSKAEVYLDPSGRLVLDAHNAALEDLLARLGAVCQQEILIGPGVEGTMTAHVNDGSADRLLRRILEPFGFAVTRYGSGFAVTADNAENGGGQILPVAYQRDVTDVARLPRVPEREPTAWTADRGLRPSQGAEMTGGEAADLDATQVEPIEEVVAVDDQPTDDLAIPQSLSDHAAVAYQLISTGRVSTAIDILSEAVMENPSSPELFRVLGMAYFARRDFESAQVALERAVGLDKTDPVANQLLGRTLNQLGQPERGRHYLLQAKMFDHGPAQTR